MNTEQTIRAASSYSGVPLTVASRESGRPDSYINSMFTRGSVPQCDTMAALLQPMGYVLAALPADEAPTGALVIDPKEKKE